MAANKGRNKSVKKSEWKGYHNVNLTKQQEVDFKAWAEGENVEWEHLGILCNNGYKFSLRWDDFHGGVSASLYAESQKMEWAGYTLSSWAGDIETAIKLLFYKHYVLCLEQWEIAKDQPERQHSEFG